MQSDLQAAIAELVRCAGQRGMTMGQLVDRLVDDGRDDTEIEAAVWDLLQQRKLTPHGFVCRTIRTKDAARGVIERRSYEFVLVEWSPQRDQELEAAGRS